MNISIPNPDGTLTDTAIPDIAAIPMAAWQKVYEFMSGHGYAWPDAEYAKSAFARICTRMEGGLDGSVFPDHVKALASALGLTKLPKQKHINLTPKATQKVVKCFGITNNLSEAGYILPDGRLLDFSGKNDGGEPGMRSRDHREIGMATEEGGTAGMIKFMQAGNVRIDASAGFIDMNRMPTDAQFKVIVQIINLHRGEVAIDVEDNLMWEPGKEYPRAGRSFRNRYDYGTNPFYVIQDIKNFYLRKPAVRPAVVAWIEQNCRFAQSC